MDLKTKKAECLTIDPPMVHLCKKCGHPFVQKYVLDSFVSPDDRIQQRLIYEANQFLYHDVNKQIMDATVHAVKNVNTEFLKGINQRIETYKSSKDDKYTLVADLLDKIKSELCLNEDDQTSKVIRQYRIDHDELTDRFEVYRSTNNKELESKFNELYGEETSVRGKKCRGVFEDIADARNRAEMIRKEVEPFVHSFVGPVGYWCPWDPNADSIQDEEFAIDELNDLMRRRKKNEEDKNEFFAKRKQEMIDNSTKTRRDELRSKLREKINGAHNARKKNGSN